MTSKAVAAFEESVMQLPVTLIRCPTPMFSETIRKELTGPAVAVPMPFDGISLEELPVTLNPGSAELTAAKIGVTPVTLAIGDYGSIVIEDRGERSESVSLLVEKHIVVLRRSDIVQTMSDAIEVIAERVRSGLTSAVIATGPSATADMGELVHGAHGPQDVTIILLEDQ